MFDVPLRRVAGACFTVLAILTLAAAGENRASSAGAATLAATSTGLVAAYSFDEGSGATAADASGSGNALTIQNGTWTTSGEHGGALVFNGTSTLASAADAPSLDASSGMTLEAWVYQTGSSGYRAIVTKERAGGGFPYGLETNGGVAGGYVNTGTKTDAAASTSIAPNTWTHLAVTYDGSAVRLYVDGVLAATASASGAIVNSSDPLRIGGDQTYGEWFKGRVDDVRVYTRALTAAEIQLDMNTAVSTSPPPSPPPASPPVAAYSFDTGSGTTVADASGSGNNGTITGATWTTAGRYGGALSFDGASDYVTVADSNSLDLSSALTVEAWVYPTGTSGWQTIVAKERSGGGFPYGLEAGSGVPDGYVNTGSNTTAAATSAVPTNGWTHFAVTYDGSAVRLYVNGALATSAPASGAVGASADPLRIGGDVTWGEWFQGRIDDVRVYNRTLSAADIQTDMNTPVGGGSPPPPPPPSDTQPPTPPSNLTVTGTTQTSASLSWGASTDNVGVAGYGVYNGATLVSQTTATNATVSGLSCGTTYTLGVDAFDAAGNRSTKALTAATTSACSSSTASVFVSTTGSDSNPCTQSAPCNSFNRAFHVAQPGQIVEVAGGTYGQQDVLFDSSKTSSADVVFQPAAGASVTISGNLEAGDNRFEAGMSHATFKNMTVLDTVSIPGCGVPDNASCPPDSTSPGNDLTFQNLRVKGTTAFFCASCSNVSLIGGTWGPDTYQCRSGQGSDHPEIQSEYTVTGRQSKRPHGILIDGTVWQNFARCTSTDHTECLQAEPADDMTIRNSVFKMCDTITVNLANDLAGSNSAAGYRAPNNILIENNFFDTAHDWTGGPTYYALNIRECTNCTIRYNSWSQGPRMPTGEIALNVKYIANAGPMTQWTCNVSGVSYSHNVFEGAACGPTDKNVTDVAFVNRSTTDLHLTAGSPAINAGDPTNYPSVDIDGQLRPLGGAPDAGADERQ